MCWNIQIAHSIEEILNMAEKLPDEFRRVLLAKLQERSERGSEHKQSVDVFS